MVICIIVVVRFFRRKDAPTTTLNQIYHHANTSNDDKCTTSISGDYGGSAEKNNEDALSVYDSIDIKMYEGKDGNIEMEPDSHDGRPSSNLVGISSPRYVNNAELAQQFASTVVEPTSRGVADGGCHNAGLLLKDEVPSSSGIDATPPNDRFNSMEVSFAVQSWV